MEKPLFDPFAVLAALKAASPVPRGDEKEAQEPAPQNSSSSEENSRSTLAEAENPFSLTNQAFIGNPSRIATLAGQLAHPQEIAEPRDIRKKEERKKDFPFFYKGLA
jgi:hypothetical protein